MWGKATANDDFCTLLLSTYSFSSMSSKTLYSAVFCIKPAGFCTSGAVEREREICGERERSVERERERFVERERENSIGLGFLPAKVRESLTLCSCHPNVIPALREIEVQEVLNKVFFLSMH